MGVADARSGGDLPQQSESREDQARSVGRVPPSDIEAEKAVLSALLLDNDAIHTVLSEVRPADFYHPAHQKIYESMLLMQDANEPVDLHTLSDFMNSRKTLDAIGGPVYLAEIADYEATAANVLHHARIVRDKSIKRGLISGRSPSRRRSSRGITSSVMARTFGAMLRARRVVRLLAPHPSGTRHRPGRRRRHNSPPANRAANIAN